MLELNSVDINTFWARDYILWFVLFNEFNVPMHRYLRLNLMILASNASTQKM